MMNTTECSIKRRLNHFSTRFMNHISNQVGCKTFPNLLIKHFQLFEWHGLLIAWIVLIITFFDNLTFILHYNSNSSNFFVDMTSNYFYSWFIATVLTHKDTSNWCQHQQYSYVNIQISINLGNVLLWTTHQETKNRCTHRRHRIC